ncbi:MAG: hypothetical protein IPM32_17425 [Ignavibacteriae bacterium]|nr:hypothetical protein [Ignavibacteriota bacterium]
MRIKTRVNLVILILLFGINLSYSQKYLKVENFKSEFAKKVNKEKYYKNLISEIDKTLSNLNEIDEKKWIAVFTNSQSIFYKSKIVKTAIENILTNLKDKNFKLQRSALETAFALYLNDFNDEIEELIKFTNDEISFAIAINYLLKSGNSNSVFRNKYLSLLKNKFPEFNKNIILSNLYNELELTKSESIPSIKDLLNHTFQKGKTIIYSIHRKNRKFHGITIIKKPDGNFSENKDGTIFYIPQLALSYSNLPYYLPNGNTPQGIYSVIGIYVSPTETIGPSPNILSRIPFEVSPEKFYHSANMKNVWSEENYTNLLPKSWQQYSPIYQSYHAGKIGRKLIIIHGSTDEINYYKNEPYFPLTPTQGCLSSKENWDEGNGKCSESDQIKLINAFNSTKQKKGFLVVFEIDDKEKPVTIEEILPYIK